MTNLLLATNIRSLHYEATGQMVSDEEILNYYKNLQDRLTEAMCYAEDCDWYISKLKETNALPRIQERS